MEIWKEIEGYEGIYWISNLARVKNKHKKILKQSKRNSSKVHGYLRVTLYRDGRPKTINVHLLVARAFVFNDNPVEKKVVNHIIPFSEGGSNLPQNLEWVTYKENTQHALRRGNMRTKEVAQLDKDGNTIEIFLGVREAGRRTGINQAHISSVANKKRKTAGGFYWKYI